MISVAPAVPPAKCHQCYLSVLINATCQCPSVPYQCHISVPYQCTSMPNISAHLSCLSLPPINASQCSYQCCQVSATYQSLVCLSVCIS
ncbi:unnamed protein product, partial [Staurois parvus]